MFFVDILISWETRRGGAIVKSKYPILIEVCLYYLSKTLSWLIDRLHIVADLGRLHALFCKICAYLDFVENDPS